MESNFNEKDLTRYFKLTSQRFLYVIVEKAKFLSLPQKVQSYATNANLELLNSIGLTIRGLRGEVFISSTENGFYVGSAALRKQEQFQNRTFTPIAVNPLLLFQKIVEEKPGILHLDYATKNAIDIDENGIEVLAKIAFVSRLAKFDKIFVAQNKKGYALSMEFDGKKYALAYFNPEDGGETLKGLQIENPGAKLESNAVKTLAQNVLLSEFEGLVVNPASAKQMLLSKADLELLLLGIKVCKPGWFSVDSIKGLFTKAG